MGGKRAAGQVRIEIEVPEAAGGEGHASAVRSAPPMVAAPLDAPLSVPELVDALYDIVATGVEPVGNVTCAQIETFLHEHARRPKTAEVFAEFFECHGIEGRVQTQPRVPLRMLEPVPRMEAIVAPVADVSIDDGPSPHDRSQNAADADAPTSQGRDGQRVSGFARAMDGASGNEEWQPPSAAQGSIAWLPKAAVVLGVGVLLALGASYFALNTMRDEVTRAQLASEQTRKVAAERQAELAESLRQNRQMIDRLERQNGLLLDNLLPSPVLRSGESRLP